MLARYQLDSVHSLHVDSVSPNGPFCLFIITGEFGATAPVICYDSIDEANRVAEKVYARWELATQEGFHMERVGDKWYCTRTQGERILIADVFEDIEPSVFLQLLRQAKE